METTKSRQLFDGMVEAVAAYEKANTVENPAWKELSEVRRAIAAFNDHCDGVFTFGELARIASAVASD